MATAMLLYYRLAQSAGQNIEEAEDELGIRRVQNPLIGLEWAIEVGY